MAIKIYTDASSNLFSSILKENNSEIIVLPMALRIDDKEYLCYKDDIDVEEMSKDFYSEMAKGAKPKTSLTSPGLFMEKCKEEVGKGNQLIYVTLASGISGTFQSASLIAEEINNDAKKKMVAVIDSKTAGLGEGRIALKAENLAKSGLEFEKVISETEEYVKKVRSEFTVDSIKYLANTGRVSNVTAIIANMLSIKPLLYGSDEAKIEVTSKVHGRKNALKKLAEQVNDNIASKDQVVYISHCNSLDDAKYFENLLHEFGISNTKIYFYDLVTGAHVGPGTIAVFYEGENRAIAKKNLISSLLNK